MPKTHKPQARANTQKGSEGASVNGKMPRSRVTRGAERNANGRQHQGQAPVGAPGPRARAAEGGVTQRIRAAYRVPPEDAVVRTDPDTLEEVPRESHGLFELVPTVARRALTLGLSAREPSCHVFVAAEPEVMIEDDIVRYAERFAGSRP